MAIQNFEKLGFSRLRKEALQIAEAGLLAIDTKQAVNKQFIYDKETQQLDVMGKKFNLSNFKRVIVLGFGKAAFDAVSAIQESLKDRISCGFVIDLKEGEISGITCRVGTHPHPSLVNVAATKELVAMLEGCSKEDLVLVVVSGGGSALLCYPHDMSCEVETSIISALTVKGANIFEINTVRKHISLVKGGNLAKICYPATVLGLIFSDVPGNELDMIASGPTVMDSTTVDDAVKILQKYEILAMCGLSDCNLKETPKESKYFENVHNVLLVSPQAALSGMQSEAEKLGWKVRTWNDSYEGEAKVLGSQIVQAAKAGECLLGAGESTVKVSGKGKGGRNQEMALSALSVLAEDQVLLTIASDGVDNSDAAGALVDSQTLKLSKSLKLDIDRYLENNDSYNFFKQTDSLIFTGKTNSNVSDLFVCLKE